MVDMRWAMISGEPHVVLADALAEAPGCTLLVGIECGEADVLDYETLLAGGAPPGSIR